MSLRKCCPRRCTSFVTWCSQRCRRHTLVAGFSLLRVRWMTCILLLGSANGCQPIAPLSLTRAQLLILLPQPLNLVALLVILCPKLRILSGEGVEGFEQFHGGIRCNCRSRNKNFHHLRGCGCWCCCLRIRSSSRCRCHCCPRGRFLSSCFGRSLCCSLCRLKLGLQSLDLVLKLCLLLELCQVFQIPPPTGKAPGRRLQLNNGTLRSGEKHFCFGPAPAGLNSGGALDSLQGSKPPSCQNGSSERLNSDDQVPSPEVHLAFPTHAEKGLPSQRCVAHSLIACLCQQSSHATCDLCCCDLEQHGTPLLKCLQNANLEVHPRAPNLVLLLAVRQQKADKGFACSNLVCAFQCCNRLLSTCTRWDTALPTTSSNACHDSKAVCKIAQRHPSGKSSPGDANRLDDPRAAELLHDHVVVNLPR
mmetsp:Transcript_24341/g.56540  ORF Transcript_24341/g.56540 Transcript_24341/m.56540 type:complete len:419 (+) Transcript_24341:1236-2492(+)